MEREDAYPIGNPHLRNIAHDDRVEFYVKSVLDVIVSLPRVSGYCQLSFKQATINLQRWNEDQELFDGNGFFCY